ncbi:MAG TPA: glutamate--tRNA ligase [Candidatus Limnocylindria bacterium]|nr:glutamate--tRNA ligase [Candidatus Limnocylindria bacterium]
MTVRTRFAPSPTGYLHIGGARTALFSWLYARHHGGTFVLRIEDTDRARSTPESIQAILDGLAWLGIHWDEGPFYQTQRTALYRAAAERLEASGHTYRCYCTPEELEARRAAALAAGRTPAYDRTCRRRTGTAPSGPSVLRFRTPLDGTLVIDDIVKGPIHFAHADLDDFVIERADGTPLYNFCVVVDDVDMRITHVIRGDDHVANTPRQALLYQALGATLPRFAHVPLILGLDKTRLSKRHGATAVTAYRDLGFLPDALVNYLVRLGWSHGDQEIFTRAELVQYFTLEQVGRSPAVFNPEKLEWLNGHYMKAMPARELAERAIPYLEAQGTPVPADRGLLERAVATLQERARTLVELARMARFYFVDTVDLDPAAAAQHLTSAIAPLLDDVRERLERLDVWTAEALERLVRDVASAHGLKLGKLAQPIRVALTGSTASPGLFEVMEILGREKTLGRLDAARARIVGAPSSP